MIITEKEIINGKAFIKTYSNENRYVIHNGEIYETAYDLEEYPKTYVEGDIIPTVEDDYIEASKLLLGVE